MESLEIVPWLLVPAIFIARVVDVSMGTVRTILLIRGRAAIAACIGFVEVLIWIVAAGQVLSRLDAWYLAVAYAAGFGAGNLVGVWLESKLAIGIELVRVVSENAKVSLGQSLRALRYSVIELQGAGEKGTPVEILFVVERRKGVAALLSEIERLDPEALCTVSEIKRHVTAVPSGLPDQSKARRRAVRTK
ncbi:MAG: DUF2179 domain-containing protein [Planctomycetes bacterium]|nr:DUF2179 domain-containing protein [Planctomycetota bacterium]NOG53225.1 DUF2179 domain-containing protein [Planctomycetota bacterium]